MFTGLIREIGSLRRITSGADLTKLVISAPKTAPTMGLGDSLAVNGICLTVVAMDRTTVTVEAAAETRRLTTLKRWRVGQPLHLEPALRAGQALDGHLVQGHIDGTGKVSGLRKQGGSLFLTVTCGPDLARWLMPKGSVAVDGVSLTVDAGPHRDRFTVNIIPHTLQWTCFDRLRQGQVVNLEMDVLVKAARTGQPASAFSGLSSNLETPGTAPSKKRVPSMAYILDRGFGRKGTS